MTAEAAFAFRQETLFQMVVQVVGENASDDLPGNVQQGNASVVVANVAVNSALVKVDNCSVLEILRDFSLTPHLLEEHRQMAHELGVTVFVDLSRDRVRSWRFRAGKLLHGPDGIVERRREVEVGVGLHLRQTGDDGFEDGGGTVKDASEVLGPSL
ncbi:hypothetical protein SprV_0100097300 [Sparganum proliferum]